MDFPGDMAPGRKPDVGTEPSQLLDTGWFFDCCSEAWWCDRASPTSSHESAEVLIPARQLYNAAIEIAISRQRRPQLMAILNLGLANVRMFVQPTK